MKWRKTIPLCASLAAALWFGASTLLGQEGEMEGGMGMPQPNDHHEFFENLVGTWDAKVKMTMMPGAPPMESKGTSVQKLGPGPFWITVDFTGDMAGMPFIGHGVYGFDPIKNVHTGFWVDSTNPVRSISEGTCSNGCKKVTLRSESFDPASGRSMPMTEVTEWKDNDHIQFTMSAKGPDGKDIQILWIEYTRRKISK